VTEQWSSPIDSGNCEAGTLPLFVNGTSILTSINWSC
jgi:hypothetical protein